MPGDNKSDDAAQESGEWAQFQSNWSAAQSRTNAGIMAENLSGQLTQYRRGAQSAMSSTVAALGKAGNLQLDSNNTDLMSLNMTEEQMDLLDGADWEDASTGLTDAAYAGLAAKLLEDGIITEDEAGNFGKDQLDSIMASLDPEAESYLSLYDDLQGNPNHRTYGDAQETIIRLLVREGYFVNENAAYGSQSELKDRYEDWLKDQGYWDAQVGIDKANRIKSVMDSAGFDKIIETAEDIDKETRSIIQDAINRAGSDPLSAAEGLKYTSGTDMIGAANALQQLEIGRRTLINQTGIGIFNTIGAANMADDQAGFQEQMTEYSVQAAKWQQNQTFLNNAMSGVNFGLNILGFVM